MAEEAGIGSRIPDNALRQAQGVPSIVEGRIPDWLTPSTMFQRIAGPGDFSVR
jgi:hypothetical protein